MNDRSQWRDSAITYAAYRDEQFEEVARLFHNEFIRTYPELAFHRDLDGYRSIIRDHVLPDGEIQVAMRNGLVVGFMALKPHDIDQLYVSKEFQGMGIGSQFISMAKETYPDWIRLYTLASNERAIRFYKHHDFRIIKHGIAPDEGVPDVLMEWQWTRFDG